MKQVLHQESERLHFKAQLARGKARNFNLFKDALERARLDAGDIMIRTPGAGQGELVMNG